MAATDTIFEIDGSRFDWDSPQVVRTICAYDSISIQLFSKSIFKLSFYALTFNVGYHTKKIYLKKERQRKSIKCVIGY
jgi:hypothetical protein